MAVRSYVNNKNCCCVNFDNRCNVINGSVSMIHDLIPLRTARESMDFLCHAGGKRTDSWRRMRRRLWYESWKSKLLFCENIFWKKRKERCIVTVSEYSRQCIINRLKIVEEKVVVIGNGWEHIMEIEEVDEHRDERIRRGEYFFFIGNINPHKNVDWILKTAEKMTDEVFVIAGKVRDVLADARMRIPDNVIWIGYISDGYMKLLLRGAKALLFPSLEEGFGIPPLEALALGTPVIAADIPVLREIYGDAVYYIDPCRPSEDLNAVLKETLRGNADRILEIYSWEKAAGRWEALLRNIMDGN